MQEMVSNESVTFLMSYCMTITSAIVFFLLIFINAPYGRYGTTAWGPPCNSNLAWFIQELPSFLIPVISLFFNNDVPKTNLVLLTLYIIHYTQRALIFPFLIKGGKPTPFIPFSMAVLFCTYNGILQSLSHIAVESYPTDWLTRSHVIFGIILFACGMMINIHSDHILRNLRRPGEVGYKIPRGGMFEYVSGANYLGEILEWTGYGIACSSLAGLSFALFSACNLGPRAVAHHRWYKEKFEDYPKLRKAVIPFIL